VTEMYSPVPIEKAPATSAAAPVSTTVCAATPPPPIPAISEALVTSPSTAPNTVGRSQPPDTSRWPCDQPASAVGGPAAPGTGELGLPGPPGGRTCSSATCPSSPAGRLLSGRLRSGAARRGMLAGWRQCYLPCSLRYCLPKPTIPAPVGEPEC